jgi:serine/threonine-protein kinase
VSHQLGRYRIVRPLGEGGMGRLYLGEAAGPSGFSRRVVVKLVKDELDEGLKLALLDEARLVASLVHRNIVPVLDLDEAGDQRLVVLEHVDGMDLGRLLQRRGTLPWPMATFIASEIAAGLDYAHRKSDAAGRPLAIVHRDVSPANILLSWEGEVKLTDFGVAKFARPDDTTAVGLQGNLGYMAPEQARRESVDARADLFALGVVLYEALTGQNPFSARTGLAQLTERRTVPALPGSFPAALRQVVAQATQRDPAERFVSAAALRQALLDIPGQSKDPAQALAALLVDAKEPSAVNAEAMMEAVLGGAGRLTVRPTAAPSLPAPPPPSRRPSSKAMGLVGALLLGSLLAMVAVASHSSNDAVAGQRPSTAELPRTSLASSAARGGSPAARGSATSALPTAGAVRAGGPAPSTAPVRSATATPSTAPAQSTTIPARSLSANAATTVGAGAATAEDPTSTTAGGQPIAPPAGVSPPTAPARAAVRATAGAEHGRHHRGVLSVNAVPWANIFLDGHALGHTPRQKLSVDTGRHRLRLVTARGDVRTQTIDVAAGHETRVSVDFAKP